MPTCECGCGEEVAQGRRFVTHHNFRSHPPRRGVLKDGREFMPDPNPSGLCMCGCGGSITPAKRAIVGRGIEKGHHARYIRGHNPGNETSFKPGPRPEKRQDSYNKTLGRWRTTTDEGRDYRYRVVAEQRLGRPLRPGEVVHHINGDSADDRPENLIVLDQRTHMQVHAIERGWH